MLLCLDSPLWNREAAPLLQGCNDRDVNSQFHFNSLSGQWLLKPYAFGNRQLAYPTGNFQCWNVSKPHLMYFLCWGSIVFLDAQCSLEWQWGGKCYSFDPYSQHMSITRWWKFWSVHLCLPQWQYDVLWRGWVRHHSGYIPNTIPSSGTTRKALSICQLSDWSTLNTVSFPCCKSLFHYWV